MNRRSLVGQGLQQFLMGQFMPNGVDAAQGGEVMPPTDTPTPQSQGGWNFGEIGKQFANSAVPGIFNGQGGFDPMNAFEQNTYGPYLGENGIFNLTQNGPWRRK